MSEIGTKIFKACSINSWLFGILPTKRPTASSGLSYEIHWKHPIVMYALAIGIINFVTLGELARNSSLVFEVTPTDPTRAVDPGTAFYEKFLTKLMVTIFFVSNMLIRITGFVKAESICSLFQNVDKLRSILVGAGGVKSERKFWMLYGLYFVTMTGFWARALCHQADAVMNGQDHFWTTYLGTESSVWLDRLFLAGHLLLWHSYASAPYFAYTFLYVGGLELMDVYGLMCKNLAKLRNKEKVASTFKSLTKPYYDLTASLMKEKGQEVGDGWTIRRFDEDNEAKKTQDKKEQFVMMERQFLYTDEIVGLRQQFKLLFESFEEYRKIAGVLCVAMMMESTYCFFYCLSDIISWGENRRACSDSGAIVNLMLFATAVNLGNVMESRIKREADKLKYFHACDGDNLVPVEDVQAWKRQLVALEEWVMNWTWKLTAMDLFTVNRALITGVLAVITSYVMIVFQMKLGDVGTEGTAGVSTRYGNWCDLMVSKMLMMNETNGTSIDFSGLVLT